MNLKQLLFLKAASPAAETNLLDYTDLVNKNYGGDPSNYNVRTEGVNAVEAGKKLRLTGPKVTEVNIRFYDESKTYQSTHTISKYAEDTESFDFIVPEGCAYIRPKWNKSSGLTVEEFIASKPVIKYT